MYKISNIIEIWIILYLKYTYILTQFHTEKPFDNPLIVSTGIAYIRHHEKIISNKDYRLSMCSRPATKRRTGSSPRSVHTYTRVTAACRTHAYSRDGEVPHPRVRRIYTRTRRRSSRRRALHHHAVEREERERKREKRKEALCE